MDINQINQIKQESNGNFGQLVTDLKDSGVVRFMTCASTAKSMYFNHDEESVYDEVDFFNFEIGQLNKDQFVVDLKEHQQGLTDFPTWLEKTASSGISYWIVDLEQLTCTYYAADESSVYVEQIPGF